MSETTASLAGTTSAAAPTSASAIARARRARIALRGLQVLLALFYGIASALPKLIAHPSAVDAFDEMGWGSLGMYTIGALELAGAVALLIPVLQSVAAVALGALMVGAFVAQVVVFDGQNAATPLILLVPLALIAWKRRESNAELLRWARREM
ncbi:putative membrane protein YphA (DoxX/SURF4 family) [Streptomyces sp. 3330]|uniref:DoxX family protein n=1 Tax=Streptomyces sp. 3330 TaxID=2817755 RepID=UPI00285B14DA|nr:DoxX family protein [Streptomyces sp. 3330]MDR6978229.1 putative membrane protein YphA (DoxX/SURF4 family) [Streptomyces sp. 3330]